jgi:exonuclease III
MCYWQHRKGFSDSWDFLLERINPDIALVQETVPNSNLSSLKHFVWEKIGGKRNWGSGIFSRYPVEKVEFDNSYRGSVIAGKISLPNDSELTAISIHVLLEHGYSVIPLHRIFSDLTWILERKMRKRDIILGGDLNASLQFDKRQKSESHRIFFDRVKDFGLLDCLAKFYDHPIQTYRNNKGNTPWQLDYLFLTKRLEDKLEKCYVIDDPIVAKLSDHNPVVAELSF